MEMNNNGVNTNYLSQEFLNFLAERNISGNKIFEHRANQKYQNRYSQAMFINGVNNLMQKRITIYKNLMIGCVVATLILLIQPIIAVKVFLILPLGAVVYFALCYFQNKKIAGTFTEFCQVMVYFTEYEIGMLINSISSQKNIFNSSQVDKIVHNAMNVEVLLHEEKEYISMHFQNVNKLDSDLNAQLTNKINIDQELSSLERRYVTIEDRIESIKYGASMLPENRKKYEELNLEFDLLGGEPVIARIKREKNDKLKEPKSILKNMESNLRDLEGRSKEINSGIANSQTNISSFEEEQEEIRKKYFDMSKKFNQDIESATNAYAEYKEQFRKEKLNLKLIKEDLEKKLIKENLSESEKTRLENELKIVKEKQRNQDDEEIFSETASSLERNVRNAKINYDSFENTKRYAMDEELRRNREKLNMEEQRSGMKSEELQNINYKIEVLREDMKEINQQIRQIEQECEDKLKPFENIGIQKDILNNKIKFAEQGIRELHSVEDELENIHARIQFLKEESFKVANFIDREQNRKEFSSFEMQDILKHYNY